jgi:hypothetical protein
MPITMIFLVEVFISVSLELSLQRYSPHLNMGFWVLDWGLLKFTLSPSFWERTNIYDYGHACGPPHRKVNSTRKGSSSCICISLALFFLFFCKSIRVCSDLTVFFSILINFRNVHHKFNTLTRLAFFSYGPIIYFTGFLNQEQTIT